MLFPLGGYDPHLFHQLLEGQVGVVCGDFRIVERNEFQAISTIKATQDIDLRPTEIALAIEYNDVLNVRVVHRGLLAIFETDE